MVGGENIFTECLCRPWYREAEERCWTVKRFSGVDRFPFPSTHAKEVNVTIAPWAVLYEGNKLLHREQAHAAATERKER